MCPTDSAFFGNDDITTLGNCAVDAFNANLEAHFLWTVRNELEPKWNYVTAYDNGWLKATQSTESLSFLQE
jgi:hypothetical protein